MPLTKTVAAGDQLVSGASKTFDINVNDLLANNGLNSNAISLGQLTVFGHSDALYNFNLSDFGNYKQTGTSTHYNAGACNHGNCNVTDYTYTRSGHSYHYDTVTDTMKVSVGDSSGSDTSEWQQSQAGYKTTEDKKDGSARFGWKTYQTTADDFYGSYSGDLSVTLNLDSKALGDIVKDGILSLSIWGMHGQFNIDSLRLDLLANLPEQPADSPVPVPTSLLLTGLGLAALATVRRRKA
ncbi:hypothetical protein ASD58_27475 [Duganella sp. Root1480D1]|nr:hypothetical protein ASD58_27475 [Duganella sp. Root1480D1]